MARSYIRLNSSDYSDNNWVYLSAPFSSHVGRLVNSAKMITIYSSGSAFGRVLSVGFGIAIYLGMTEQKYMLGLVHTFLCPSGELLYCILIPGIYVL